jgi:flavin-dependent dehydrogenase
MIKVDVVIVGGGPAGAACAWRLMREQVSCLVIDQREFPRNKVCAGWITPAVLRDLQFEAREYPFSFTTFKTFDISLRGIKFKVPTHQHAIRRIEFDVWMLKRSGAPFQLHTVKSIQADSAGYLIDGEFFGKYLVGAGGTHCPVSRALFEPDSPKPKDSLIVAQEEEFRYDFTDDHCKLWFLENGLPGYAWYVPKTNGFVNLGVGGKAEELKSKNDTLKRHWNLLVEQIARAGLIKDHVYKPVGHSYYLRQRKTVVRQGNAFLVGDSAGLATVDMGEGISPSIQSGIRAAESIIHGTHYNLDSIPRYSIQSLIRF